MSEKTEERVETRRHKLFSVIIEAARKAGASEGMACSFAKRLMEDDRIVVILGLAIDVRPVRRLLGRLLRLVEGRLSGLCEQVDRQGTGFWHT